MLFVMTDIRDKADAFVRRSAAKMQQMRSRRTAEERGTPGSFRQKDGARSSNKPEGGKMAR